MSTSIREIKDWGVSELRGLPLAVALSLGWRHSFGSWAKGDPSMLERLPRPLLVLSLSVAVCLRACFGRSLRWTSGERLDWTGSWLTRMIK
jgi:hypothetical protein